ncbi:MAG: 50S ribosomal protein L22 [Acidimicrobiales bacterium mtb01]|nr:50S ribosomal protein L22 [Actinomycetota bacterium]TEX47199.1 MAG: 50S ribosomal protein L22 [Acidimicrobiales bacterium mtb01]
MTGPKLNERDFVRGERTGTRASVRGSRMSASKARVVLDLIRGLDVVSADQVLQFTEREAARVVRKVLASAVANAINNDNLDAESLYVRACYADEGPTMRRFSPRARGRATRINKRTCHITIVVDTLDDDALKIIQARRDRAIAGRRAARGGGVADRRARVAKSRQTRTESSENTESTAVESGEATAAPETTNTPDSAEENS